VTPTSFSVGYELSEAVRRHLLALPEAAWEAAIDGDGEQREGASVTGLTESVQLSQWPQGTRLIVRCECPHPGAAAHRPLPRA
jgi:hypothetical protein